MSSKSDLIKSYVKELLNAYGTLEIISRSEAEINSSFDNRIRETQMSLSRMPSKPSAPYLDKAYIDDKISWFSIGKEKKRVKEVNRERQAAYARQMIEYEKQVEQYNKEKSLLPAKIDALNTARQLLLTNLEKREEVVKAHIEKLLEMDLIHSHYTGNIVALCYIYQCFDIGWADSLTGPDGAYKQYEDWAIKQSMLQKMDNAISSLSDLHRTLDSTATAFHAYANAMESKMDSLSRTIGSELSSMNRSMDLMNLNAALISNDTFALRW